MHITDSVPTCIMIRNYVTKDFGDTKYFFVAVRFTCFLIEDKIQIYLLTCKDMLCVCMLLLLMTVQSSPGQLPVIVVDEIGKMELFSRSFEDAVRQLMSCSRVILLATIPAQRRIPVEFADEVRHSPTVRLFEVRMLIRFLASNFLYFSSVLK